MTLIILGLIALGGVYTAYCAFGCGCFIASRCKASDDNTVKIGVTAAIVAEIIYAIVLLTGGKN